MHRVDKHARGQVLRDRARHEMSCRDFCEGTLACVTSKAGHLPSGMAMCLFTPSPSAERVCVTTIDGESEVQLQQIPTSTGSYSGMF